MYCCIALSVCFAQQRVLHIAQHTAIFPSMLCALPCMCLAQCAGFPYCPAAYCVLCALPVPCILCALPCLCTVCFAQHRVFHIAQHAVCSALCLAQQAAPAQPPLLQSTWTSSDMLVLVIVDYLRCACACDCGLSQICLTSIACANFKLSSPPGK